VGTLRAYLIAFRGFEPDVRRFLLSALLAGAAFSLYWIDFNLYLRALGIDAPTIGLISTTGSLAGALVAFPASRASDRLGRRAVLVAGLASMALALAGMVFVTAPVIIALLVFVYVGGQGAFMVVQNPFLMERSRAEHRNELFAVAFAIENVTNVAAAIVGGLLAQAIASAGVFEPSDPATFRILLVGMAVVMAVALATIFRLRDDRPTTARRARAPRSGMRLPRHLHLPRLGIADRRTFVRLLVPGFLISLGRARSSRSSTSSSPGSSGCPSRPSTPSSPSRRSGPSRRSSSNPSSRAGSGRSDPSSSSRA
jgi:MFS family permease